MARDKRPEAVCNHCGNTFKYKPSQQLGKFCSNICSSSFSWNRRKQKIETEDNLFSAITARHYLTDKYGKACSICQTEEWNGKDVPLVCDHINGNSGDWSIKNIRMICCNCDAQTPFYKGRNRGNGRHSRKIRYQLGLSY